MLGGDVVRKRKLWNWGGGGGFNYVYAEKFGGVRIWFVAWLNNVNFL